MMDYDGLAVCKSKVQITEVETIAYHDSNQEEDNTRLEIHLKSHFVLSSNAMTDLFIPICALTQIPYSLNIFKLILC